RACRRAFHGAGGRSSGGSPRGRKNAFCASQRARVECGRSQNPERNVSKATSTRIKVGIGGWTYEPWRDNFYPKGLAQAKELNYASRQVSAIEINGTYYSTFKPETFRKWHDDTPDGFMF